MRCWLTIFKKGFYLSFLCKLEEATACFAFRFGSLESSLQSFFVATSDKQFKSLAVE